jgi:TorA maturation chaperone TorD
MTNGSVQAALPMLAWSRIFSLMAPEELRLEAWEALELPKDFEKYRSQFWTTFLVGNPMPVVSLLLHSQLNLEGDPTRADFIQVMTHLGLEWNDMHVPPDQLGAVCEIYACAIEREESVLIRELRERYLLPWCAKTKSQLMLSCPSLVFVPEQFAEDLKAVEIPE